MRSRRDCDAKPIEAIFVKLNAIPSGWKFGEHDCCYYPCIAILGRSNCQAVPVISFFTEDSLDRTLIFKKKFLIIK